VSAHPVGSPQALREARALATQLEAEKLSVQERLKAAYRAVRLNERWNAVDRALLAEQFNEAAWATVARLDEHVRSLAGVRDEEGLAPVAGHLTAQAAALLRRPGAARIGHDEFLLVCFEDEADVVVGDSPNDSQVIHAAPPCCSQEGSVAGSAEAQP
jgi:hypothetical protein